MDVYQYARTLLEGESLQEKLLNPHVIDCDLQIGPIEYTLPSAPGRERKFKFSSEKVKFPARSALVRNTERAQALNFFANHELMAIEMMAAALLVYPTQNQQDIELKQGIIATIVDEQKHFSLYRTRIQQLGYDFGDFPVNDFFWRQMKALTTPSSFYAVVALTLEAANLDFALYYGNIFKDLDDQQSAQIMQTIYNDEINHVKIGQKWLSRWRGEQELWDYYLDQLPGKLTPARAKGIIFDRRGRRAAGLPEEFIAKLERYRGDFRVTNRKEWEVLE